MTQRLTLKLEAWLCCYVTLHAIYNLACVCLQGRGSASSNQGCRWLNPTSGIKNSVRGVLWLSRIDLEGSVLFGFLEGAEGFFAWANGRTRAKFDIMKFDGTGDFGLWRIKMRALLIQHGCEAALEVLPADMEAEAKAELNKKAHSAVILCL
ncbi:hypothetical protein Tco_0185890, partial [Tanacetum coccineum]